MDDGLPSLEQLLDIPEPEDFDHAKSLLKELKRKSRRALSTYAFELESRKEVVIELRTQLNMVQSQREIEVFSRGKASEIADMIPVPPKCISLGIQAQYENSELESGFHSLTEAGYAELLREMARLTSDATQHDAQLRQVRFAHHQTQLRVQNTESKLVAMNSERDEALKTIETLRTRINEIATRSGTLAEALEEATRAAKPRSKLVVPSSEPTRKIHHSELSPSMEMEMEVPSTKKPRMRRQSAVGKRKKRRRSSLFHKTLARQQRIDSASQESVSTLPDTAGGSLHVPKIVGETRSGSRQHGSLLDERSERDFHGWVCSDGDSETSTEMLQTRQLSSDSLDVRNPGPGPDLSAFISPRSSGTSFNPALEKPIPLPPKKESGKAVRKVRTPKKRPSQLSTRPKRQRTTDSSALIHEMDAQEAQSDYTDIEEPESPIDYDDLDEDRTFVSFDAIDRDDKLSPESSPLLPSCSDVEPFHTPTVSNFAKLQHTTDEDLLLLFVRTDRDLREKRALFLWKQLTMLLKLQNLMKTSKIMKVSRPVIFKLKSAFSHKLDWLQIQRDAYKTVLVGNLRNLSSGRPLSQFKSAQPIRTEISFDQEVLADLSAGRSDDERFALAVGLIPSNIGDLPMDQQVRILRGFVCAVSTENEFSTPSRSALMPAQLAKSSKVPRTPLLLHSTPVLDPNEPLSSPKPDGWPYFHSEDDADPNFVIKPTHTKEEQCGILHVHDLSANITPSPRRHGISPSNRAPRTIIHPRILDQDLSNRGETASISSHFLNQLVKELRALSKAVREPYTPIRASPLVSTPLSARKKSKKLTVDASPLSMSHRRHSSSSPQNKDAKTSSATRFPGTKPMAITAIEVSFPTPKRSTQR